MASSMMGPTWALVLLLALGGGGNQLLDYIPSDGYWKAKSVSISAETMLAEVKEVEPADIAKLTASLGSPDPTVRESASAKIEAMGPAALPGLEKVSHSHSAEVATRAKVLIGRIHAAQKASSVRRLMAIRALGELKAPGVLPRLRELSESKEPFVAEYARCAMAAIEGKPYVRPSPAPEVLQQDLSILPGNCGAIAQLAARNGRPVDLAALIDQMPAMPGQDKNQVLKQMLDGLMAMADKVGNVRFEGITVGVADDVGDNSGFVVLLARGQFDAEAIGAAVAPSIGAGERVGGLLVFKPDEHVNLVIASDQRVAVVIGPNAQAMPSDKVLAALQAGPGAPAAGEGAGALAKTAMNPEMARLLASVDKTQTLWAVMRVTPAYRQADFLSAFDTMTLVGRQQEKDDAMKLELKGVGKDAKQVSAAADEFNAGLNEALNDIRREVKEMPPLKPVVSFLESIKCESANGNMTITGSLSGTSSGLFMVPLMFAMPFAHAEVVPQPAPANVPPNVEVAPAPQ